MSILIEDMIAKLSPERQKRVRKQGKELIKEYKKLVEFRKAVGLTQVELAGKMSITQENVSRLEKRDDMHLSTLRKYVEALGGELEILIRIPDRPLTDSIASLKLQKEKVLRADDFSKSAHLVLNLFDKRFQFSGVLLKDFDYIINMIVRDLGHSSIVIDRQESGHRNHIQSDNISYNK